MNNQTKTPAVSVIVPNYNHAKFLHQRLDTILSQTYTDFELIILDDCSTDESKNIIQQYQDTNPQITTYFNSNNSGSTFKQWNFGVNQAKGDYIWIAESDDYANPNFLKRSVSILEMNKQIGLVYCRPQSIDKDGNEASKNISITSHHRWDNDFINDGYHEVCHFLASGNKINNVSGVLFRKNNYIKSGLADENMKYCGDWHLYIRILQSADIAYIAETLNFVRFHKASSYHNYFIDPLYIQEMVRVYSYVLKHFNISNIVKQKIFFRLVKNFLKKLITGPPPTLKNYYEIGHLLYKLNMT